MVRKRLVKVMLSNEQREILRELSARLGTSESEAMRMAFMDYAKALNLLSENIPQRKVSQGTLLNHKSITGKL